MIAPRRSGRNLVLAKELTILCETRFLPSVGMALEYFSLSNLRNRILNGLTLAELLDPGVHTLFQDT
ncbi:MAG: hypothetical protein ACE5HO_15160 [bacterium]